MIRSILIAELALTVLGCSEVLGLGEFVESAEGGAGGSDGGGGGTAGAVGSGGAGGATECGGKPFGPESCDQTGCGALECNSGTRCVATQVCVLPGYWIDATEVTRGQYAAWLATMPATMGQPSFCAWNTSFTADATCMNGSGVCKTSCTGHPQVCVDWCDAYAYCAALGKRLCGAIGGGANPRAAFANPAKSQWYGACASGFNGYLYPYGDTYDPHACNGWDKGPEATVATGTIAECQSSESGYEGVYDLSGNAREWDDCCDDTTGALDICILRGGAFASSAPYMRCDSINEGNRSSVYGDVGFRCCAD